MARSGWRAKLYSLLTGASWGLFYGATIGLFGFESWPFLIVTGCVIGICSAATAALAPHLTTSRRFVALLLGPGIVMDLIANGRHGFALAGMFLLYLLFSLHQGRLASSLYWSRRRGHRLQEEAITLARENRHAAPARSGNSQ